MAAAALLGAGLVIGERRNVGACAFPAVSDRSVAAAERLQDCSAVSKLTRSDVRRYLGADHFTDHDTFTTWTYDFGPRRDGGVWFPPHCRALVSYRPNSYYVREVSIHDC